MVDSWGHCPPGTARSLFPFRECLIYIINNTPSLKRHMLRFTLSPCEDNHSESCFPFATQICFPLGGQTCGDLLPFVRSDMPRFASPCEDRFRRFASPCDDRHAEICFPLWGQTCGELHPLVRTDMPRFASPCEDRHTEACLQVQCCFTSTEPMRTITDNPLQQDSTWTFTQLMSPENPPTARTAIVRYARTAIVRYASPFEDSYSEICFPFRGQL